MLFAIKLGRIAIARQKARIVKLENATKGYRDITAGGDRWRTERRSPRGTTTSSGVGSIRDRVAGRGLDAMIRAALSNGEEPRTAGACVSFIFVDSED